MAKLSLTDIENFQNETTAVAALAENNDAVITAIENTLSRDGTSPNEMTASLDMNNNRILNLPTPTSAAEPATKAYVDAAAGDASALSSAIADAQASADAASDSADAAAASLAAFATSSFGSSTTTLTPSVADKTFTTDADKNWAAGCFVTAVSAADSDIWMTGVVSSYTDTTLIVTVQVIGTATEASDWLISLAGTPGVAGAAGADYSDSDNLAAIDGIAANGLYARTAAATASARTITGTTNLITVTDGDGVSGNPTLTVGSNVVRKDSDNTLAAGIGLLHTVNSLTAISSTGTQTELDLSNGFSQTVEISSNAGTYTFPLPASGNGEMVLEINHTGTGTATIAFSANGNTAVKNLGGSLTLGASKVGWFYITRINGRVQYQSSGAF